MKFDASWIIRREAEAIDRLFESFRNEKKSNWPGKNQYVACNKLAVIQTDASYITVMLM